MSDSSDPLELGAKSCPKCRQILPLTSFNRNRTMSDGRSGYCKSCEASLYRARQAAKGKTVREKVPVPPGHKHCRECSTTRPHDAYSKNRYSSDGFAAYCKTCMSVRNRERHIKTQYGLSRDDLQAMIAAQLGMCAICFRALPPTPHVDHDHVTGKVRAVLCFNCNGGLGQFRDEPSVLRRAAAYLEGDVWTPTPVAAGVFRLPS